MRPERASDRQRRVDAHFQTHALFWKQIYAEPTLFGVVHQQRRALALEWIRGLDLPPASRVLELGCGAGLFAVDLARQGFAVHAIDVNEAMLELTRREVETAGLADRVSLSFADAHELASASGTFDVVVALGVIPFLHTPASGLQEMARVLAPNRYAIFSNDNPYRLDHLLDPRHSPPFRPLRRLVRAGLVRVGRRSARKPDALPVNYIPLHTIRRWMREAELDELRCRSLGYGPLALMGRPLLPESVNVHIHNWLQSAADRGVALLRAAGSQHLILAARSAAE